eukprot:jgi/Tetstr1/445943/TSEL_033572.t1
MADESAPSDEAASALSSGHQAQDPEEISCEQGLLVSPALAGRKPGHLIQRQKHDATQRELGKCGRSEAQVQR